MTVKGVGIMIWLIVLCAALALAVLGLGLRLHGVHQAVRHIRAELGEKLESDTNTLLSVPTRDGHMRALAADLNRQLRQLRDQRQKYLCGDRELKEAVTNISHDLRTPLTAAWGYLELLKEEPLSDNARRYLGSIENRMEAMKHLTQELLRYSVAASTARELPVEPVNVGAALEESAAAFYAAFSARGIVPDIRMPEGAVIKSLNRAALSRVLGNILSNALNHSGGDLEIVLTGEGLLTFTNKAPDLDEVQVGRLFDRFFTVETARDSTGLGLAISRTLIEQMHGSIDAAYADGRLTVSVRL